MKFRRLYWVTEQLGDDGSSEVAGVFTSIPDLVEEGLHWCDETTRQSGFRLTLVKLDSKKKPLGSWTSPDFQSISTDLEEYIKTQEFGTQECESLVDALKLFPGK